MYVARSIIWALLPFSQLLLERVVAFEYCDRNECKQSCDETDFVDLRNGSFLMNRKIYQLQDCENKSLTLATSMNWKAQPEATLKIGSIKRFTVHTTAAYIGQLIVDEFATRVRISKVEMSDRDIPQNLDKDALRDLALANGTIFIEEMRLQNYSTINMGQIFGGQKAKFTFANVTIKNVEELDLFIYEDITEIANRDEEIKRQKENLVQKTQQLEDFESTVSGLKTSNIVTGVFLFLVVFGAMPGVYCYFKR